MIDGVIVKETKTFPDERGFFREVVRSTDDPTQFIAQVSHGLRFQGVATAWHIHKTLEERFYIVSGTVRLVLKDCRVGKPVKVWWPYWEPPKQEDIRLPQSSTPYEYAEVILGDHMPNVVYIPPGVAHGYVVLQGPCNMIYVASQTYAEYRQDEGRIEPDRWGLDWMRPIEVK